MSTPRTVLTLRFENEYRPHVFFREVSLDGTKVLVEVGRLDTGSGAIENQLRGAARFASAAEAKERFDALVAHATKHFKKQTRREAQVTTPPQVLANAASNPALEASVRTDANAARTYADWLQTQGDPRGELAALRLAGRDAAADTFVLANVGRLLGELDVKLGSEVYDLKWHHGFLQGASLKRGSQDLATTTNLPCQTRLPDLTTQFLALPIAQQLTDLRFGLASYERNNDWAATLQAVAASPRAAQVRSLCFDDYTSEDCDLSRTPYGDFSTSLNSLTALEVLHVRSGGGGKLGEVNLPRLRKFVRESGGLSGGELEEIITAKWPALQSLEVWFGRQNYGAEGTVEHVERLLATLPAGVTHLGLANCEFAQELLPLLVASPVLKRLRTLDLSKGVLRDAEVDLLLRQRAAFAHLEKLDLDENQLNERVGELKAALPQVRCLNQRTDDLDEENDARARYAAVGE